MIRIEVQDYCQSCLEFEPDVENPTLFYADSKVVKQTDTVIRCKHRTRCENIKHYIDKENGGNSMENIKRVGEGFTEKDEYDAYDISIKNLRTEKPIHPWDVKVDRSSWFGNRFKMKNESERDKVCELYKKWFYNELYDSAMQAELSILKDILLKYGKLNLFCWCAPKRCHAEVIKEYLLETLKGVEQ